MLIIRTLFLLFLVMGLGALTEETLVTASSAGSTGSEKAAVIPEGFGKVKLDKTESLDKLCNQDLTCETIFMKVNKVDRRHISAGKTVLLPVDIDKASQYIPVPQQLSDSRGEREVRVFLDTQYFGAYENGALLFWGPISSGRKSNPTWPGEFFVNYKQRHKRSIKYNNAPMPYSINYDGPYFIHQQALPGHPASRGCVRLLEADAKKLFSWMKVGDSVTVL
ncbi:L,D-transpeptidase [Prosthecochloris sp.]|uniref:L,D-transpeptidase n=1 Tax=Prosthecochloris sp. TaxID=290513 RepID=UPI0025DFBB53|nr:L,D-transpeptidase [Prosthecochloris sp.]